MEIIRNNAPQAEVAEEDHFVIAIASTATKGPTLIGEEMGGYETCGISQE